MFTITRNKYEGVIFDLDGVVTKTEKTHAAAWKALFDEFLARRSGKPGEDTRPFDLESDYLRYVDGKPRYDGVKSFLESRGIHLDYGEPADPPERDTVCGLGNRKNLLFNELLKREGVEVYESTVKLIHALRAVKIQTAIVSSSRNCVPVLEAARAACLFDAKVDGVDAEQARLEGKPAPDIFLEAARRLNVAPDRAVVVEDAIAGVEAGRRGGFGLVIGVDRASQAGALRDAGADLVVSDLAEVSLEDGNSTDRLPSALEKMEEIAEMASNRRLVVFLDYDGTLTPIVARPTDAILSEETRAVVRDLASRCTVAVISGRDLPDVQKLVGIGEIFYAGSHGFDIAGPQGWRLGHQKGEEFLPLLDRAELELKLELQGIRGCLVERKKFSVAVHLRRVDERHAGAVEEAVERTLARHPELRKSEGKKVFDLRPNIDWDKGKAVLWLLEAIDPDGREPLPLYIGDDITDEDAFAAIADRGIGIVVRDRESRSTAARFALNNPDEVRRFLQKLIPSILGGVTW